MKLKIKCAHSLDSTEFYYFEVISNAIKNDDENMANYLNIKLDDYISIMKKYGAYKYENEYYFSSEKACENFINSPELTPYIVMNKLTEE